MSDQAVKARGSACDAKHAGKPKPQGALLRWAGGKRWLVDCIESRVPNDFATLRYVEPFLGSGAVYLRLAPPRALLSDINARLMHFHAQIAIAPDAVWRAFRAICSLHSEDTYYAERERFNRGGASMRQAARLLYLNKACFNGIYRVNRSGEFNVPFGRPVLLGLPRLEDIRSVGELLGRATLLCQDFRATLDSCGQGDFVYLDPPYPSRTSLPSFTHYHEGRFVKEDHTSLLGSLASLHRRGAKFMLSMPHISAVARDYAKYSQHVVLGRYYLSGNSHKQLAPELLVTNY